MQEIQEKDENQFKFCFVYGQMRPDLDPGHKLYSIDGLQYQKAVVKGAQLYDNQNQAAAVVTRERPNECIHGYALSHSDHLPWVQTI